MMLLWKLLSLATILAVIEAHNVCNCRKPMRTLGGSLAHCPYSVMRKSTTVPTNVHRVRPADIKVVGALGDSITAAAHAKNWDTDPLNQYPDNSFVMGVGHPLHEHITMANVLRKFNPSLVGGSFCPEQNDTIPYHVSLACMKFNAAVGGRKAYQFPGDAHELIGRMSNSSLVDFANDWKLITMFVGTNDIGYLSCRQDGVAAYNASSYKAYLEQTITMLKAALPRTIINIVSIWKSQISLEAQSIVIMGRRLNCACNDTMQIARENLMNEYRAALYELQNEKKFEADDFTVVVQGFMDNITDPQGNQFDMSFYAAYDNFHISKYGHALMGRNLWNCMMQPVGAKDPMAPLYNTSIPLSCPNAAVPYIRTWANSVPGFV